MGHGLYHALIHLVELLHMKSEFAGLLAIFGAAGGSLLIHGSHLFHAAAHTVESIKLTRHPAELKLLHGVETGYITVEIVHLIKVVVESRVYFAHALSHLTGTFHGRK